MSGEEQVESIKAAFTNAFGDEPRWVARAPGRVNLIGEHTDYSEGFVLPLAIDRACVVAVAPGRGGAGVSRFRSMQQPEEAVVRGAVSAAGARESLPAWSRYSVGVAALLGERAGTPGRLPGAVDVLVSSDVPLGSGLSSSAALEVGTAKALAAAWGISIAPLEVALLCQRAEHEFAGVPCGIMDQFASVHGRAGHAMLLDCRTLQARQAPLPPGAKAVLLVCNSNVKHELTGGEYAERRAWCEGAARAIGVKLLRDASEEDVARHAARLSEDEHSAARHVVSENRRTRECGEWMDRGVAEGWPRKVMEEIGRRMLESHASLRDDLRVSCEELDALVEIARTSPGVFGSRMTGGGFGGCTITLVEAARADELERRLRDEYARRIGRECTVMRPVASDGARLV